MGLASILLLLVAGALAGPAPAVRLPADPVLRALALARGDDDDVAEAERIVQSRLAELRGEGDADVRERARALTALGTVRVRQGDLSAARDRLREADALVVDVLPPGDDVVRSIRIERARVLGSTGALDEARRLLEGVLETWPAGEREGRPEYELACLALADTYSKLGHDRAGRRIAEEVEARVRETLPDDHPCRQSARRQLAFALEHDDEDTAALWLREKVLAVARARAEAAPPGEEETRELDVWLARFDVARLKGRLGRLEEALDELSRAVAEVTARAPGGKGPGHVDELRLHLAEALGDAGRLDDARALLEDVVRSIRSREHLPRRRWKAEKMLATTLMNLGRFAEARERLVDVGRHAGPELRRVALYERLWTEIWLGLEDEIEATASDLLANGLAWLELEEGRRSPRALRSVRRQAHLLAEVLATAAFRSGHGDDRALLLIERVRRLGLSDPLRPADLPDDAGAASGLAALRLDRLRSKASIAAAARAPDDVGTSREALVRAVREADRAERRAVELRAADGPRRDGPLDEAALVARFGPRERGVAYVRFHDGNLPGTGERQFAYVVDGDGVRCVRIGPAANVDERIASFRRVLDDALAWSLDAAAQEEALRAAGGRLRALLLDPVLAGDPVERLVVSPGTGLSLVPFDGLPLGDGWVGDRITVELRGALTERASAAPRGSEGRAPAPRHVVVVGDLDYDDDAGAGDEEAEAASWTAATRGAPAALLRGRSGGANFPRLPETGPEIDRIAERFDGARVTRLRGSAAARAALVAAAEDATWLHLATHAWFDPLALPTGSGRAGGEEFHSLRDQLRALAPLALTGIALSGANAPPGRHGRIDGVLTGEEVAALDLSRCRTVVLSACDGAIGEERPVDGTQSLLHAFRRAGARAVIASRWRVSDRATRTLMDAFYRRVIDDGAPRSTALWDAKRALRRLVDDAGAPRFDYRDWAGWVLVGDPGAVD